MNETLVRKHLTTPSSYKGEPPSCRELQPRLLREMAIELSVVWGILRNRELGVNQSWVNLLLILQKKLPSTVTLTHTWKTRQRLGLTSRPVGAQWATFRFRQFIYLKTAGQEEWVKGDSSWPCTRTRMTPKQEGSDCRLAAGWPVSESCVLRPNPGGDHKPSHNILPGKQGGAFRSLSSSLHFRMRSHQD